MTTRVQQIAKQVKELPSDERDEFVVACRVRSRAAR